MGKPLGRQCKLLYVNALPVESVLVLATIWSYLEPPKYTL